MRRHTVAWMSIGVVAVMLIALQLIPAQQVQTRQILYTSNIGELTHGKSPGQTFTATDNNLSGVGVMFATYSGRANTGTIEFHLRDSGQSQADIRTSSVDVSKLSDNQIHTFSFDEIKDSKGKQYYFFVTSPDSKTGSAVTVDINIQDPYPHGSAYINGAGKQSADLAFELSYKVPLWKVAVGLWHQKRHIYELVGRTGWPILVFTGTLLFLRRNISAPKMLIFLFIIAAISRFLYAQTLPLTNDEGNYLYDASTIREGHLAGGDGYVKAPLVIAWIALWQSIAGDSILAGRLSSVLIGAATLFPLYILARELWGKKTGLIVAALWATFGAAIVFNIYIHTQPVALFFGISGLAVVLIAGRQEQQRTYALLFAAGALLGLGVASRKSVLALGLVPLLFVFVQGKSVREYIKNIVAIGAGFLLVIAMFLLGAFSMYGQMGVQEAIGLNSAEDGITSIDPAELDQVRAYSLRGMTPFFRESLPLILLSLIGLGAALERLIGKAGWVAPWVVFIWAWRFFFEYEGEAFMQFGIEQLWWLFGVILAVYTLLPAQKQSPPKADPPLAGNNTAIRAALVVPLWIGGLVFFYMNWIKFHANYISEFIPPLVLLSSLGVASLFELKTFRKTVGLAAIVVALWAALVSNYITYLYEHTGTFDLRALQEAATWASENIPQEEPMFTGAAAVPYLSGHHVSLDIAHPRWYAYEFTRKDPERLNTFLPPAEDMVQAFRDANWVLMDQQTGFSFLMEYSEIEASLESDFEQITSIDNGGNPLTFYRRIK